MVVWAANFFSLAPLTSNPGTTATTSISYDNNGNVIQVGTTTFYTYDYANHLTQSDIRVGNATTTTTYAYGPFGERVSQTAASTTFLYPNKFYSVASSTALAQNMRRPRNTFLAAVTSSPRSIRRLSVVLPAAQRSRATFIRTTSALRT
jgi:hypothetical protein